MSKDDKNSKPQVEFHIAMVGSAGVGKTSIVKRYLHNTFDKEEKPTIGVENISSKVQLKNKSQQLEIVDLSGNNKFKGLLPDNLKNAQAVILVYDITDRKSFADLPKYMEDIKKYCTPKTYVHVVGNRLDQNTKRQVGMAEGKNFADSIGAKFVESSASNPSNIATIFQTIINWSQVSIIPGTVAAKTEKLLTKLNNTEVEKKSIEGPKQAQNAPSSLNITALNNSALSASGKGQQALPTIREEEAKADSQDQYFEKLLKKSNLQFKARRFAEKATSQAELDVFRMIHKNKIIVDDEPEDVDDSYEMDEDHKQTIDRLMTEKKMKDLDKLRREISHNLLSIEEQIERLGYDQYEEHKQAQEIKKTLTKKLLSVEQNMAYLRCEELLTQQPHSFQTKRANYRSLDESMLLKSNISMITNPEHFKQQEEFITKIVNEWEALEEKREKRAKALEDSYVNYPKELVELRKKQNAKRNQLKRRKIVAFLKDLQQIQERRKVEHPQQLKVIKTLLKTKVLAEVNVEKFDKEWEHEELEKRKQKLKEIRDLRKPITAEIIKKSEADYLEYKKKKEEERQEKIKQLQQMKFHSSYESQAYKQVKEETLHHKRAQKEAKEKKEEIVKTVKRYAHQVQEEHFPEVDENKQNELQVRKEKLSHNPDPKEYVELAKRIKQKGVFFDKDGRPKEIEIDEQHYEDLKEYQSEDDGLRQKGKNYLEKGGRNNVKHNPSQKKRETPQTLPPIDDTQLMKPKDYLREVKSELHLKSRDISTDWEKYSQKKMPGTLLDRRLVSDARQIEDIAKRKEQILKARQFRDASVLDEEMDVDRLLVSSIRAKLAIVNQGKK